MRLSDAVVGVLLGTQTGRDMSIVNSFELPPSEGAIDEDFFRTRRDQCECFVGSFSYI